METREEFYVYLNSQFNRSDFPHNKNHSFTNVIKPSITLDSSYDVALENIIFEPSIYTIKKLDENFSLTIFFNYIKENGAKGGYSIRYIPEADIKTDNIYQLIEHLNNDLITFLVRQKVITRKQDYIFRLKQFSSFIEFKKLDLKEKYKKIDVTWLMSKRFAKVLGIRDLSFDTKPKYLDPPEYPERLNCIHIYSDIIEPTYLGEQTVHLLDIIAMPHVYYKSGTLTMYKRVNKTVIDEISIRMTDGFGNLIPFTHDVSIVVVLHFKRVL